MRLLRRSLRLILGRSLRGRVGRFFLFVGLVPLLALGLYTAVSQERIVSKTAEENLANYARLEAASVEYILRDAAENVAVIAANPALTAPTATALEKAKQLTQAQEFFDVFDDVTLVDTSGNVVHSTSFNYYGAWNDKAWFQEALTGVSAISEPHFVLSPPKLVVVFTAPVFSRGKVSGVVAGQMNMQHIWDVLDSAKIGSSGYIVAVDRNGDLVSHPDKDLILTRLLPQTDDESSLEGQASLKNEKGDELVGQTAPVNVLGWEIVALQADGEVHAVVRDAMRTIVVLGTVVVALVVVTSFVLSTEITRPINSLAATMRGFTSGQKAPHVPHAGLREIDQLTISFNAMATDLDVSTQSLKDANEELEQRYHELADARHQAATDSLTGLLNHRSLQEALAKAFDGNTNNGNHLAVLMMDVNGFKLFNETYGHQAGDTVLRQVAEVLKRTCRPSDIVGRYGGDEFMVILPETDRPAATETANRLIAALAEERVFTRSGEQLPLAMSIGLAAAPDDSGHKEELLAHVDASLYQAKQSSGSALVTHGEPLALISSRETPLGLFETLVRAVDMKDRYTRRHSQLDAEFAVELARAIGLSEGAQGALRIAGLLHDVGKIGVPDHILKKPGPLDSEERAVMQQHVVLSTLILQGVPTLRDVSDAVSCHHERWDGAGYPRGIKGASIPLLGRILAVVDAYSAMILDRPYRKALSEEEALLELQRNSGTQFDPELVAAFVRTLRSQRAAA